MLSMMPWAIVVILSVALGWILAIDLPLRRRFTSVISIEKEVEKAKKALNGIQGERSRFEAEDRLRREQTSKVYQKAKETYERLQRETTALEENLEDISFGVYKPHYDYETSDEYRIKLDSVYDQQRAVVRSGQAVIHGSGWTVNNDRRQGERMQKQYGKLLLRAFNGECDACIAKVSWKNVEQMLVRIETAFDAINNLGSVMQIAITPHYREIRRDELRLCHEMEEKKQHEAEEERRLREQRREEDRAQRELERAKDEAEEEEACYKKALERARADLAKSQGVNVEELNARIHDLERELDEARERKERAISRAEMTRSGHVYIISNHGSFGEDVLKIGMTRRLDPHDRVRELGDASVPFVFDVHGMLFSEDAPTLENELHRHFSDRRVNLVNGRKEFFRVTLNEVSEFLRSKDLSVELGQLAEAREYRETCALRDAALRAEPCLTPPVRAASPAFPEDVFA